MTVRASSARDVLCDGGYKPWTDSRQHPSCAPSEASCRFEGISLHGWYSSRVCGFAVIRRGAFELFWGDDRD